MSLMSAIMRRILLLSLVLGPVVTWLGCSKQETVVEKDASGRKSYRKNQEMPPQRPGASTRGNRF